MIAMSFRTFITKVLVFILSNLLSIRDLVDTQQLIFPIKSILLRTNKYKRTYTKFKKCDIILLVSNYYYLIYWYEKSYSTSFLYAPIVI